MSIAVPTVTYNTLVGSVIKQLRVHSQANQGEVAERLGLKQSAWSKLERGATSVSAEQLFSIGEIFNVEPGRILSAADAAAEEARATGVRIVAQPPEGGLSAGVALLGAAAVGAVVALVVKGLVTDE